MLRVLPAYVDDVLALYGRPGVGWLHLPKKGRYPLEGLVYMVSGAQKEFLRETYSRPAANLVRTIEHNMQEELGIQLWGDAAHDALYEVAASVNADDGFALQRQAGFFLERVGDIVAIDEAAASSSKRRDKFARRMGMTVTACYVKAVRREFPAGEGYIEHVTVLPETDKERRTISVSKETGNG